MTRRRRDKPGDRTAGRLLNRPERHIASHRVAVELRQLIFGEPTLMGGGRLVIGHHRDLPFSLLSSSRLPFSLLIKIGRLPGENRSMISEYRASADVGVRSTEATYL
jgi:hypothetical protein